MTGSASVSVKLGGGDCVVAAMAMVMVKVNLRWGRCMGEAENEMCRGGFEPMFV